MSSRPFEGALHISRRRVLDELRLEETDVMSVVCAAVWISEGSKGEGGKVRV